MRHVLSTAVITAPGTYWYRHVGFQEAREWLEAGNWESTVGYFETTVAIKEILHADVPVNRRTIRMQPHDAALVVRLSFPPGTKRLTKYTKGEVGYDFIAKHLEVGILCRLE